MVKRILLLNFDKRSSKKLRESLAVLDNSYEVKEIQRPEEIEAESQKVHSLFYLHTKNFSELESQIKQIRQASRNMPLNVIFKKRDYNAALKSWDLSLSSVLDKKYLPGELQLALQKCDLKSLCAQEMQLPIQSLLGLLTSTIKIKNNRDLFRQLYSYFNSFPQSIEFALYEFSQGEFNLVEGSQRNEKEIFEIISTFKLPKIFIGKTLELASGKEGDEVIKAFPVFENEGVHTWCICSMKGEGADEVLNDLFFRYLENVLIFRKNLSRVQSYLDLANKDDVTGLYNQRKLVADLAETIETHEELGETFSIMFIDVDHFKKVNDNFGHIVGSAMLTEIGKELTDVLRSSDKIYRYGGDEFVVLMPKVNIETVHKIAVRVIDKVKQKSFNVGEAKNYQLSLSIGIAEYPTDAKTAHEIVQFADSMMYVSKKSGRGKVFHVGEVKNDASSSK